MEGSPSKANVSSATSGRSELLTFLIADVRGYTRFTVQHGDEAAAKLATRFAEIAVGTAEAHGGRVPELRGDEALAVFGSPRQALRTAIELQARFGREARSDLPLRVGIGLDAGEVIPVMGGYRGGALNLAARLCSLAGPGEILASQGVIHLARRMDDIAWVERGAVQLKGFTERVIVFDVLPSGATRPTPVVISAGSARPAPQVLPVGGFLGALPESPFVARAAELRRLNNSIEVVTAGVGRVVLVSGEPGVGKTRLVQEMTIRLRDHGFVIGAGRCYKSREGVPFYPFLEGLSTLYAASSTGVRSLTAQNWSYLAKLVPEVTPATTLASESSEEQERLFRAVTGFVGALAGDQPVALLLDDLHWSDTSSLDLLLHLARGTRGQRVLMLGTFRDGEVERGHPLATALLEATRERLTERVQLRRLDGPETAELAATLFDRSDVSPALLEALYRRTDGNAFFLQETIREFIDRGLLDDRSDSRALDSLTVPESIRSLVGQRVGRLSEDAQRMLRYASVLGQQFAFDDLVDLAAGVDEGLSEDTVEQCLDEAIAVGLMREVGKETLAFAHALIQQTIYEELSYRRRRRLHRAAGEAIERSGADHGTARASELARHFDEADETARTLYWSMAAGAEARKLFAHSEAERYYRRAVKLAAELGDRDGEVNALEKLGDVLEAAARYEEALEIFDRAIALLDEHQDLNRFHRLTARAGGACFFLGWTEQGLERLKPLVQREVHETPGLARVYGHLGLAYMYMGDLQEMRRVAERGSEIARRFDDRETLSLTEQWRGYGIGGREGIAILHEARHLAEEVGDGFLLRSAWIQVSDLLEQIGDLAGAGECMVQATSLAEVMGDPDWLSFLYAWHGRSLFLRGDWDQARARCLLALRHARSEGTGFMATYPPIMQGAILLAEGQSEEGYRLVEGSVLIAERHHDSQALCLALPALAEYALLEERPDEATRWLEAAIETLRFTFFGSFCIGVLAIAFVRLNRIEEADRLLVTQMEGEADRPNRTARSGLLRAFGVVRTAQGRLAEADASFRQAAEVAHEIGYPWAEAMALLEWGQTRREASMSRAVLEQALEIFDRLGAVPYSDRTRARLTSVA